MKERVILHFVPDSIYSENFIAFINQRFDKEKHLFYVFVYEELKYVIKRENVFTIKNNNIMDVFAKKDKELVKHNVSKLFIHCLCTIKVAYVYKYFLHSDVRVYWCVWGSDLFSREDVMEVYDEENMPFVVRKKRKESIGILLKRLMYQFVEKRVLLRIDCVTLLVKNSSKVKLKETVTTMWPMYPIEHKVQGLNVQQSLPIVDTICKYKNKILVGNAGSVTNNHLSVIRKLSRLVDKNTVVIVPLSYGDEEYISYVISEGKKLFGEQFIALTDFYPAFEYNIILSSIDIAIWNHKVSEGFGNIRLLLEYGKKIYFRKTRLSNYQRLDKLGIAYEDIEIIDTIDSVEELCSPYTEEIQKKNRAAILSYASDEQVYKVWDEIFGMN